MHIDIGEIKLGWARKEISGNSRIIHLYLAFQTCINVLFIFLDGVMCLDVYV